MHNYLRSSLLGMMLVFLLGSTACRTSREEQASRSVDDFFKAVANEDFEKAKELSTEKSKPVLVKIETEAKAYRPDVKPAPMEVIVVDKTLEDTQAWVTVDIKVGPKVKREKVRLVWENDRWRVVVLKPQIKVVRYVVFYDQYELVVLPKIRLAHPVIEVSLEDDDDDHHHHHHGRGHAYGHRKHKHKHHSHDD